jgi:predicted nucleic acid-binding protein
VADVLLDTDVFVDHLRGSARLSLGGDAIHYSVITRAELFAGRDGDEAKVDLLLAPFRELPVDRRVAETSCRIRRASAVRMPDALIAATAVVHGLTLVTRNVRDFRGIAGLDLRPVPRRE